MHKNHSNRDSSFQNYKYIYFFIFRETKHGSHFWSVPSQFQILWSPEQQYSSLGERSIVIAQQFWEKKYSSSIVVRGGKVQQQYSSLWERSILVVQQFWGKMYSSSIVVLGGKVQQQYSSLGERSIVVVQQFLGKKYSSSIVVLG